MVKVEWFGHSCFRISADNYYLVIDPYTKVYGYKELAISANEVVCSHTHYDHSFLGGVMCMLNFVKPYFEITRIKTFHDKEKGKLRGRTDIIILQGGGVKIAHFGDIGCELNKEQKEALKGLDLALVPVGGVYTINGCEAKKMIDDITPKLTIPMHYRQGKYGLREVDELSEFTKLFDNVTFINGNSIEIPNDITNRVAVLQYLE